MEESIHAATIEALGDALEAMLPVEMGSAVARERDPSADWSMRFPREADPVTGAAGRRRAEYFTGRECAREAMRALGQPDVELAPDVDGIPVWPAALCGSITHSRGICAAVAADRRTTLELGLDIERLGRLNASTAKRIVHPNERSGATIDLDAATLRFSLKEAFYKAQFPRTGERANFHDACLEFDPTTGHASLQWLNPLRFQDGDRLCAAYRFRFKRVGDCVIALCWRPV